MKRITLELSLKPFKKTTPEYIKNTCRSIFEQWRPLLKNAEEISLLLWTADGSEILEYSGNLDAELEWGRYIGSGTLPFIGENDRKDISPHERKRLYMPNPPKMTYEILKNIVSELRSEGEKVFPNVPIRIGNTFDIGPEFANSRFKYQWHKEICPHVWNDANDCVEGHFIDSTAILNGDKRKYAAYPDGIPDGTPFGLFFGKQTQKFFADVGFDYLWLSNGLGFSADPWALTGKIYDGNKFCPEALETTKNKVFEFWKHFRNGCPDYPLECRGTNNSVGIDYATDGVPLYDIYNGNFNITPPPNSPWAALTGDYGLELMGHMSRICELPGNDFMFRYYVHDPWWVNSPQRDRYEGEPHDIYLPMSVSRINSVGKVESANLLNILTIDNSYGEMPDDCVNESVPHILRAEKDSSDEPAPFVWLYPMKEYTHATSTEELSEMYFGDNFIRREINNGFPLNCVISTDNFKSCDTEIYKNSIIIASVSAFKSCKDKLDLCFERNIPVIVYGKNQSLEKVDTCKAVKIDTEKDSLADAVKTYGYDILWNKSNYTFNVDTYPRAMTINRSNNAFYFSVCNKNTTVDCLMRFPLGIPLFVGGETEIKDGYGVYRFPRSAHKECRIFIEQKQNSIVSVRETPTVNPAVGRRLNIYGLHDATVYVFPEKYCRDSTLLGDGTIPPDSTPEYSVKFTKIDNYLKCEHITGSIAVYMPKKA